MITIPVQSQKSASLLCRIVLGLIFVYASYDKILHPGVFAVQISNYNILPGLTINLLAVWIPWIELLCGAMLFTGFWIRPNAFILSILLLVFIIAMGSVIVRGLEISCGCFDGGDDQSVVGGLRIIQDVSLLLCALWLMKWPISFLSVTG
jgi:uncharacterized membrane protein YphA (DoxX/SURF4 family)